MSYSPRHNVGKNKSYFCVSGKKVGSDLKYFYYLVWQYSAWIHYQSDSGLSEDMDDTHIWGCKTCISFSVAEKNRAGYSSFLPAAKPEFEGFCHLNML